MNRPAQKNFAIQDVHNITGDLVGSFDGPIVGEATLNPTMNGITFFRGCGSRSNLDIQFAFFQAVDKAIGGLDGIIVYSDTGYTQLEEGLELARQMKKHRPSVQTILLDNVPASLVRESGVFEKTLDDETADFIRSHGIQFSTTRNETRYSTRFYHQDDIDAAKRMKINLKPVEFLDVIISGFGTEHDVQLHQMLGLHKSALTDRALTSAFFDAVDSYEKCFPTLKEIQNLVRNRAKINDWRSFIDQPKANVPAPSR